MLHAVIVIGGGVGCNEKTPPAIASGARTIHANVSPPTLIRPPAECNEKTLPILMDQQGGRDPKAAYGANLIRLAAGCNEKVPPILMRPAGFGFGEAADNCLSRFIRLSAFSPCRGWWLFSLHLRRCQSLGRSRLIA